MSVSLADPSSYVRCWRDPVTFPTYEPQPADPNPMFLEQRVYQGSSGKVYPLPFIDRIAEKPVPRVWEAIHLENEFLYVMILPQLGGRIHVARDKTNGYDFVYRQGVIKPALVGLAGPWISGGIEFNWPQHHRPSTFLPADAEVENHADGSVTVWLSEHDPMARMKGMHGVCLHPGRAVLEVKVRTYNRTPLRQTFLWWANVATRVHERYQSFFPPDVTYVADHAKRAMSTFPLASGRYYGVDYGERARTGVPVSETPGKFPLPGNYPANDLSWYANIPVPTSYMCMGTERDFFGGYDHARRAGLVHVADHHIAPGKKQWTWGNHAFGYAWDRNLTDADARAEFAPYIELMAGVFTDNQPDFSFLQPGETKKWSQYWYPIREIGPAHEANIAAAVSLTCSRSGSRQQSRLVARVGVAVTERQPGARVHLTHCGEIISSTVVDLAPGAPHLAEIELPPRTRETDLRLAALAADGHEIISYTPQPPPDRPVPPPATEPPAPADVASNDELYLTGLHLDQYRHATRSPVDYWREALRRDAGDARCHNALGLWHFRHGEWSDAERHFRAAIARLTLRNPNPADGESYYHLGETLLHQTLADSKPETQNSKPETPASKPETQNSKLREAYNAFSKAAWNHAWQPAAFHALAEIDCRRTDWEAALGHLDRALSLNTDNLRARNLKVIVLRRLSRFAEAGAFLAATLAIDRLDWWARHLHGDELCCDMQTRLDLAHDHARAGLHVEAIALLSPLVAPLPFSNTPPIAPENWTVGPALVAGPRPADERQPYKRPEPASQPTCHVIRDMGIPHAVGTAPLVSYTLAWLCHLIGDSERGRQHLAAGMKAPRTYCFPARLEEIHVLEFAMAQNPRDARAPYYLGNLFYDRRRHREAIALWQKSARLEPSASVTWRNLGIGYFNVSRDPVKARAAYDRALRADPQDARVLYERDQLWKRLGESPAARLRELEKHRELVARRDDLTIEFCALLNQTGRHTDAQAVLAGRKFQPWEGGEGLALGQHVRTHLALGRAALERATSAPSKGSKKKPSQPGRQIQRDDEKSLISEIADARAHFEAALAAPENLGEARHLLANPSDIHFWLGSALEALAAEKHHPIDATSRKAGYAGAREHWMAAATFRGDFQGMRVQPFSEMTYWSARSLEKIGRKAEARGLFRGLLAHARQLAKTPAKIDYFATSLPALLLFNDDLQARQLTAAKFLEAQARLGLRETAAARRLLREVLRRDPSHAAAADLLAGE